jgi:hypothetical protein
MVAEITPWVRDVAEEFSRMAPELLIGASGLLKYE